jgi:hypothetical protein
MGSPQALLLAAGRYNPVFHLKGDDASRTLTPEMLLRDARGARADLPVARNDMRLHRTTALAVEMALHEESERRAMQGELAVLEEAWREAEQIARIADALPDEPPED